MNTDHTFTVVDACWDITIYVWPCGTWCYEEDRYEYTHLSDDCTRYRLALTPGIGDTLEALIESHLNHCYVD